MAECPRCGAAAWKAGFRYLPDGARIQRYECRDCGYRFSQSLSEALEKSHVLFKPGSILSDSSFKLPEGMSFNNLSGKHVLDKRSLPISKYEEPHGSSLLLQRPEYLNTALSYDGSREGSMEAQAIQQQTWKAPVKTVLDGKIVDFAWHMAKRGRRNSTISHRMYRLNVLVKRGASLEDPESVETLLATSEWSDANKQKFINCYKYFTVFMGIPWEAPKLLVPEKEPFIPLEAEIDQLIAGSGKRTSTLLQLLKETGARIGEAALLKWTDIDLKSRQVRINCPEKGSNARTLPISDMLIAMLKALPKREDAQVFNPRVKTLDGTFRQSRNRLAATLQNPRLKQIHFHTLRHWKATTEYHRTKDILHVKYILGHKRLDTTQRYVHYQGFQDDEYHVKRATTAEEEDELIEAGFELVRYDERRGEAIYRKRK